MSSCPHCGVVLEEEKHARSVPQMRRYHALIKSALQHWPETHPRKFDNEEDLRKFLQMKAGHREIATTIDINGMSKEMAMLVAEASIKAAGNYVVPVMHGDTLVIFRPKSIAFKKLGHTEFCRINDEVEAVIEAEIGIKSEALLKETERAA